MGPLAWRLPSSAWPFALVGVVLLAATKPPQAAQPLPFAEQSRPQIPPSVPTA